VNECKRRAAVERELLNNSNNNNNGNGN